MSRLNDAFDAIEAALGELTEALAASKAHDHADTSTGAPAIDEAEIQAIRAELGEAVQLLESMQTGANGQEADAHEASEVEVSS